MSKNKLNGIRIVRVQKFPGLRECCLSGTVGILFSCSASAAFAHNIVVQPVIQHATVVTHTAPVVHFNTTHTTTHSTTSTTTNSKTTNTVAHTTTKAATTSSLGAAATDLNLKSGTSEFTLGSLGNFKTITIDVGGKQDVVSLSSKLTAGELVAVDQKLGGGSQTIVLNSAGTATGGSLTLNTQSLKLLDSEMGSVNSVVVPKSVKLVDSLSQLNLSGELLNYGTVVAKSTTNSGETISANVIANSTGATITTSGSGHAADLTLSAETLTNAGTITTSGTLNLNAPAVTNTGLIASTKNNVNFDSPNAINIVGTGGTVSAANNINVRDSSYAGSNGITVTGGNFLSQNLNLNSGSGAVNVDAGNITGITNVNAASAHVVADSPNLKLGDLNVSGDPTYYNQGNIVITDGVKGTNGVPLAIVASGNIISDGGSLVTDGGELSLIAGAAFSTSDGTTTAGPNWATILYLTNTANAGGGSATGGLIDLTGGHGGTAAVTAISTASGDAGNVNIIAFAGSGAGSGTITLPTAVTINANGSGTGRNGNVVVLAGATSGAGIKIGSITATGGSDFGANDTGTIVIANAKPEVLGTLQGTLTLPMEVVNGFVYGGFTPSTFTASTASIGTMIGNSLTVNTTGAFTQVGSINVLNTAAITTTGAFTQDAGSTSSAQTLTITAGGATNTLNGTISLGLGSFSFNSTNVASTLYVGAPTTGLGAVLNADSVSVTGAAVVGINGSLNATTSSFTNTTNITLGGGGTLDVGSLTLSSPGTTIITSAIGPSITANAPNSYTISGNAVNIPFSSITASPILGVGGTVKLTYGSLVYTNSATAPLTITANGTTMGGVITLQSNSTAQQVIGVGAGNRFTLAANATGGGAAVGGNISFNTAGQLVVSPGGFTNTGAASDGNLDFGAGTNLTITGPLNTAGGTAAGDITIITNTANPFTIAAAGGTQPTNGILGNITAGNVTITNTTYAPIVIQSGATILSGVSETTSLPGIITLNTTNVSNAGTLNGDVTAASTTALAITGAGAWTNTGILKFVSGTSMNLGPLFNTTPLTYGSLTITAGSQLTINTNTLTSSGGTINLSENSIIYTGQSTTPFTINTSGGATGGIISLTTTSTAQQVIGIGAGNRFDLIANATGAGGIGGNITYLGSGSLVVNPAALLNSGDTSGGNLSLTTASDMAIHGDLNTQGTSSPTDNAGDIIIKSGSTGAFQIGPSGTVPVPTNGVQGSITGGNVTITDVGVQINTSINSVNSNSTTSAGTITLNTSAINNSGALNVVQDYLGSILVISPTTSLVIGGAGTWGPSVAGEGLKTLSFQSGGSINLGPLFSTTPVNFENLVINATTGITLSTNSLTASPIPTGQSNAGNGGSITIDDKTITYLNQSTTPLTLNASSPNGGGTVSYTSTGTTALAVGSGAGALSINVSPTTAGGNASEASVVTVSNAGNLTVNASNLVVNNVGNANQYENITLSANGTSGALVITNWNTTLVGAMGSLTLSANSPDLFVIGTSTNSPIQGVIGSVPITGQSVSITTPHAEVYISGTDLVAATGGAANGTVTITANGDIFGAPGVETINAPNISLTSTTGTIGLSSRPLVVNSNVGTTPTLTFTSPTGVYVTDNAPTLVGGKTSEVALESATTPTLVLTMTNSPLLDVPTGIVASTITITAPGGLNLDSGNIGDGNGNVTINVGTATLQETGVAPIFSWINAQALNITAGFVTGHYAELLTQAASLTYTGGAGGDATINNRDYFKTMTLNVTSSDVFELLTGGTITITGAQTATTGLSINAWGSLVVNANITAPDTYLYTTSGPAITSTISGPVIKSTNYVDLFSDYGPIKNLTVNTPEVFADTTGVLQVNNVSTAASTFEGASVFQTVDFTNPDSALTIFGGFGSSAGNIVITDKAASLTVQNSSVITANQGNLILENQDTTGTISIGTDSNLQSLSTTAGLGNVYITIGAIPSSPSTNGEPVANVTPIVSDGGHIYYSSSANPGGTIVANAPTNTLTAKGANILFNNDGVVGGITLGGGVQITADPVLTPGASAAAAVTVPALAMTSISPVSSFPAIMASQSSQNTSASTPLTLVAPAITAASTNSNLSSAVTQVSSNLTNIPAILGVATTDSATNSVNTAALNTINAVNSTSINSLNSAAVQGTNSLSTAAIAGVQSATLANPLIGGVSKSSRGLRGAGKLQHGQAVTKQLDQGNLFIAPDTATRIESKYGTLELAPHCVVLVVSTGKGLSVFNLHDRGPDSVVVRSRGRTIAVRPGSHLTVSPLTVKGFEQVNPAQFVGYRHMETLELGDVQGFHGEFSVLSAISGIKPLKDMVKATDPNSKKLASRMIKTAALLATLSRNQDPFELKTPQAVTAMNR